MTNGELVATGALAKGDRRPVTILFTDIVGSTTFAERLDPEEWREVVSGAHRRVTEAVARYEGTVAQLLGDGVLAFFGAPVAHEDDPARAVRAALDIQAAITGYARELAGYVDGFAMRAGVHTGEVVFGAVGGAGHVEYLAVGDAVNLAARLQSAAAPGKVLISASTARLVRAGYELASLGAITVKGRAEPVTVYEVTRRSSIAPTRDAGISSVAPAGPEVGAPTEALALAPLVGRERELAALTEALERLCEGHGGIVALLGEAGIGKSRLVEEAHAWARDNCRELRWLEGRALSYGAGLSYWTITQLIRADLGLGDGDPEIRARVALRRRLNGLPSEVLVAAEIAPYLAHLLGLRPEGEAAERLAALDSETLKYQIVLSIRRYFAALAAQQPLVLVCEDIHWADPSSLDALAELLALTDRGSVLLLLVARAEREHRSWRLKVQAETEYGHRYAEIALRPLSEADAQRMVENLLRAEPGGGAPQPALPEPLPRLLLDRAEGNPFFLEELVASLVEQGAILREGDAWRLREPLDNLSVPETVQGVLLARIDRLEDDVRATLQMASVIGRSFLYRLLQAIAEAERQLDRHLVVLQRADLVREKAVRPQLEYIFKHSLAQETAYQSLLLDRRREFHRRVGEALQGMYAGREEEIYGLLAHHFDLADHGERAVRYLIAAGDQARLEDALAEATRFYRRAVERLEAAGDADGAARTWLKLALVYQAEFDHAATHEAYERGFAWQQRAPHRTRTAPDAHAVFRHGAIVTLLTLDPGKTAWRHELMVTRQLFAGLAEIDADLNVVPHSARSWEVLEQGRCVRVHLRDDMTWTDGSPVTAHDYVYGWLRNLAPRPGMSEYPASLLDDVAGAQAYRLGRVADPGSVGIRALDDLTLEVCLEQPRAYFPYLLAQPVTYPLPRQAVERWGDAWWQPEHIVSNGPFRLVFFKPDQAVLERNPLYFGNGAGNLARVEFLTIPDEADRTARFRRGELAQAACRDVPSDLAARLLRFTTLFVGFLVLLPRPPLDDVRVRQAIAMAVDWRGLVERLNLRPASGGFVPLGMPGHTPGLALPYDPERARRLLVEAGYPEGRGLPLLRVRHPGLVEGVAGAQALQESLPVEVDHQARMAGDLFADFANVHVVFNGWGADFPDPDSFLRQNNIWPFLRAAGWHDPEFDAMVERAAGTADRARRMALYRQADRHLVVEEALIVPCRYDLDARQLSQPWVLGGRPDKMASIRLQDVVMEKPGSASTGSDST